jgi:hypothetical protein
MEYIQQYLNNTGKDHSREEERNEYLDHEQGAHQKRIEDCYKAPKKSP